MVSPRKLALHASLAILLPTTTAGLVTERFDVREATIDGIHNALFTRLTTCRDVVSAFISRIEAFNPTLNALISLNPEALRTADEMDAEIAAGNASASQRPLFCIPILLKDNFDAVGMNTTGACLALAGNHPTVDAPSVLRFRAAGAVILGKASLHELALEGLSVSSLGGQVVNPYDHTRTPGGSSGGSGVAVAANLAVLATGTDTVNSLRSPVSANSLFSFRPTRGLISRAGVIPISYTQDSIGAMGRTVKDIAVALAVMAGIGYDPADNTTASIPPEVLGMDYSVSVLGGTLTGLRMGVLDGLFNHTASDETSPVNDAMADMISVLKQAGVTMVNITDTVYDSAKIAADLDVQRFEYRELLDGYLKGANLTGARPASFNELYQPGGDFLVIPAEYGYIADARVSSTSNATWFAHQRGIQELTRTLAATFAANSLDAVIYPEQKNLVVKIGSSTQAGRNGILAALTGFPVITVPAGFSPPSGDAPIGVPIGMEILGLPWSEGKLLNIARHIGELAPVRKMPAFANGTVETKVYDAVPSITPNRGNTPSAYPLGSLGA